MKRAGPVKNAAGKPTNNMPKPPRTPKLNVQTVVRNSRWLGRVNMVQVGSGVQKMTNVIMPWPGAENKIQNRSKK